MCLLDVQIDHFSKLLSVELSVKNNQLLNADLNKNAIIYCVRTILGVRKVVQK